MPLVRIRIGSSVHTVPGIGSPAAAEKRIVTLVAPFAGRITRLGPGRSVRGFVDSVWVEHRATIVVEGNCAKFSQSPALQQYLLDTKQRFLVEASPVDRIWGLGRAADDEHVHNPLMWRALNLLGFALMRVREQLG